MIKAYKNIIFIIVFLSFKTAVGQFYFNNLPATFIQQNPASIGMYDSLTIGTDLVFKDSKNYYRNYNFFSCIPITALNGNIGFVANANEFDSVQTNSFSFNYAYRFIIGLGYLYNAANISFNQYKIVSNKKTKINFDFGLLYKSYKWTVGLGSKNLSPDSIQLGNFGFEIEREYNIYISRKSTLYDNLYDDVKDFTMLSSFLISSNMDKTSYILNNTFYFNNFQFGLGYKYNYDFNHLVLANIGYTVAKNFEIIFSSYLPINKDYLSKHGNNIELIAVYK